MRNFHSLRAVLLATLAVAALFAATTNRASAQLLSYGQVQIGSSPSTYAVYYDPQVRYSVWMRIWRGGGVINVGISEIRNGVIALHYTTYYTQGRHFTLRGGRDDTSVWQRRAAGQFALVLSSTAPSAGIPLVTAGIQGYVRMTHRPSGRSWTSARSSWSRVRFGPSWVNAPLARRLLPLLRRLR